MAWESPIKTIGTFTAAANLSSATHQYRLVKLTTAGTVNLTTAATDIPIGVLQNRPTSGGMAEVMVFGISKVRLSTAAAAVARGNKIGTYNGAGGFGGPQGAGATLYVLGRALDAASSVTGEVIPVLITHQGGGSTGAAAGA